MKWFVLLMAFLLQHHLNDAEETNDEMLNRPKRVVGGYFSPEGLFPYIVSLRIDKFGYYMHFCGGAIITAKYILSSAHCMLLQDGTELTCFKGKYISSDSMKHSVIAVVGTHKLDGQKGQEYKIDSYMYHSEFSFKLGVNDISLLKTATEMQFNKYVKPIAIFNKEVPVGALVVVPGWGLTSFPGDPSNSLKFIDLRTISYDDCAKAWKKVYRSQICTYTTAGEGVCTSDSGGPLVYKGDLVGLVSFGKPCAVGYPDVFTNVTHMNKWISYNTKCLSEPELLDKLLI